jgi:tellurite resistance protein TerC
MYFLLADLMHRFIYLKLGLGLVLVWVGIKLVLQVDLYKMPTWLSLGVVATIITVAIVASLRATRGQPPVPHADAEHDADQPGATPAKEAEGARATATTAEDASPTGTPTVAPHTSADEKEQVHG